MAAKSAPDRASFTSDQQSGAEAGEALAESAIMLTKKFPKLSVFLGLVATSFFVLYGLETWEFHPVIFTLMALFVFWFSTYFLMSAAIIVAVIGVAGFVITYLISLL